MKQKYLFTALFLSVLFLFVSCKDTDLTPSYLIITEESLKNALDMTNFNNIQGTNYDSHQLEAVASHNFKDVWVQINNDPRGVYRLPCKIPILASDSVRVTLAPGIRMNGMASTIPRYPVVTTFDRKVYIEKGSSYNFQSTPIKFRYYTGVHFPLLENFEQSTSFSPRIENEGSNFVIANVDGRTIGEIVLTDSTKFDILSTAMTLPGGNNIFLEIDYKCDNGFSVAAVLKNSSGVTVHEPLVNVRATKEWKKIYINLTQSVNRNLQSSGYAEEVRVNLSGFKDNDQQEVRFQMDNIKVVY